MLNYHIFDLKPWGFHLVNILFHCGVSVLVFLILGKLLTEQSITTSSVYLSAPFIAAMLFATHPIHTEAVTWIAGLPDVAFTFFYLLSFYLYLLFMKGNNRAYLLSIFSFAGATFFKEPALTLPIILIAHDYFIRKSDETILIGIKRYIPYVVVSCIYLLLRYYAFGGFTIVESYPELSTYQFMINVLPLFREYLESLVWPFNLNLWHAFHPISSLLEAKGMISVVVTALFFIGAVAAYRRDRLTFFGLLLTVVPLMPVFYIKAINGKPFAERYLYLPSVGFVLLLSLLLSWIRVKLPRAAMGFTIVFLMAIGTYSVGIITRNNVWQDSFNLWSDTVEKSPDSAMAHDNLGLAYASRNQLDKAIAEHQTALRLQPNNIEAYNNLGLAYAAQGQLDKAIAEFQAALRLKPDYAVAYTNLGHAYASQGQLDWAIEEYQVALRLNPDFAEAHNNLGIAYASQGRLDKAIVEFQAALRLKPDYAEAHNNLGSAYASQGQLDRATAEYQTALHLKPDYYEAHQRLIDILSRQH